MQEIVIEHRGGHRAGAGRKPLFQKRQRRCTITIPDVYAERLLDIGEGNMSAGVRKLLEFTNDLSRADRVNGKSS